MTGILRVPRRAALVSVAVLVAAASAASFAESFRGLYLWCDHHGLHGIWAVIWPLQIDTFIAIGELALFVALVDRWTARSRAGAWTVTAIGLAASVAANVGHVAGHDLASRATAAVPPLAAAFSLAVGLGVLKRVVEHHHQAAPAVATSVPAAQVAHDAVQAAQAALRATTAVGNPLSGRQLAERFGLNRAQVAQVRQTVLAEANGHAEGRSPR